MAETDAADRLILDEVAARQDPGAAMTVIGDQTGALTIEALERGYRDLRTHQDSLTAERSLSAAVRGRGLAARVHQMPLAAELVAGAGTVLVRLPRSLAALRDIAGLIAAHAAEDVVVVAGGRIKHMSLGMNDVLREHFRILDVSHARQKSRVLIARGPAGGADPAPARQLLQLPRLSAPVEVCAYGGAFAGAALDIGTRFLLEHLSASVRDDLPAIDLACGTGVVAAWLARQDPEREVIATDQSAAAVASARATVAANRLDGRVQVRRDDALESQSALSAGLVALNPPFHAGAAIDERIAAHLFRDAARVLVPGGELWCVWNSHLRYRPQLERLVGPTRQVARNAKFTVTVSTAG